MLFFLFSLNILNKTKHSGFLEIFGKDLTDQSIHVKTCQGHKLPAESHLGKVRDEVLNIFFTHLLSIPVEAWREVVGEKHMRFLFMNSLCKLLSN